MCVLVRIKLILTTLKLLIWSLLMCQSILISFSISEESRAFQMDTIRSRTLLVVISASNHRVTEFQAGVFGCYDRRASTKAELIAVKLNRCSVFLL